MNWIRNALIGGIFLVVFLLFVRWNEFQERTAEIPTPQRTISQSVDPASSDMPDIADLPAAEISGDDDLPSAPTETVAGESNSATNNGPTSASSIISIKTDTLDVKIDLHGGDIVMVALPEHLADIDDPSSEFVLLSDSGSHTYIAESGLIGPNGTHTSAGRAQYNSAANQYRLSDEQDSLQVNLTLSRDGANITKRFTFTRDSYLIDIDYIVDNTSSDIWKAAMYGRIKRDGYVPKAGGMFQLNPYLGAATTTEESNYEKIDFSDIDEKSVQFERTGGWVAMVQHYFVSAWIPESDVRNTFTLSKSKNRQFYFLGFKTPLYTLNPGEQTTISSAFYAGPKEIEKLASIAPHLDLTIDFGVLWFIAKPLFLALEAIHDVVGNWGFAIILLTFLIKLIFFYPSAISYRSMAKMRKLMPLMQDLKERYGDDRQRMGAETMKLYKKEGVNPLGGCLPMLMQMPVFMALYWMIMESVELRHSPFVFWINDLSVRDPLYVLPVLMGALMYVQQKLNPPPQDPMQAKIFQFMPIGFTFILMFLPAALTLYMAVNSALSFLQQYVITKQIENAQT